MTFAVHGSPRGGGTLSLSWDNRQYSVTLAGGGPADGTAH
jgi:hypothetical protein